MAEKEIKIGFPETKMEALEFFLRENDTTVDKRTGKTRYQTEYCKGECSGTGRFWCAARTRGCGTGIRAGAG